MSFEAEVQKAIADEKKEHAARAQAAGLTGQDLVNAIHEANLAAHQKALLMVARKLDELTGP